MNVLQESELTRLIDDWAQANNLQSFQFVAKRNSEQVSCSLITSDVEDFEDKIEELEKWVEELEDEISDIEYERDELQEHNDNLEAELKHIQESNK